MRKAFIIVTGILFTLLSAACRPFTADIGSYLGYWSSEAFVVSADINTETQNDASGMVSVASAKDVIITLKVQNPKSFKLVMPSASETRNIVDFAQLTGTKPVVDSDYTLEQPDDDRKVLTLTYKAGFLQNSEWGEKDVSSTITLYADDGREFKHPYTFKIKANTPPATPGFTVAKTKDLPAYYVLCITVPDMDKKVQGSRLLHKDITRIEVNGTPYPFSVNEAENRFEKPESGLFMSYSAVEKLDDSDAADVPTGGWVLYYKTDVEVREGAAKKDYTVRLADAKGLVSGILNASTKPNKAEAEKVDITKGNISGSGSGNSEGDPVIIACDSTGAELKVSSATAGVTVHGTLTAGTAEPTQYNGNPVTVSLPLNGAGEKTYKLEYYTDGEGFARTDVKTVYYKILKGYTVTFDANSGEYPDGTTAVSKVALHGMAVSAPDPRPKKQGFGVTGWYKDKACSAGKAWNFATDTVIGDMTLYAQWTAGADTPYKVEHYRQNVNDDKYPAAPTDTDNATGTTGANAAVTLKNYPGFETGTYTATTIAADGSTVVKVLYKRKQITVTFDPNSGTIDGNTGKKSVTGKYGAPLTAPTPSSVKKSGYTFNGWKPVGDASVLPSTFPAVNAEYTAQWMEKGDTPYKIEHWQQNIDDDGYTIVNDDTQSLKGKTNAAITVEHKNYDGFTYEKQEPASPTIGADGNTVVKVYYNRKQITVTFKLDGGNIGGDPSNVIRTGKYGAAFTPPIATTVKKPGYTGSSWQPVGDAPALSSTFPAKDAEYKPVWTPNTYYVQFNRNSGSGDMSNQSFIYGRPQKLSKNQFTKTGYTFKGWAKTSTGSKEYDDEAEVSNLTPYANTTVILHAVWEENNYRVRFNDGSGNMSDQNFRYTEYKALSENKFTKTGYDFDGWAKTPGGTKEYDDKQPVKKLTSENNGTVNLYARWKIKVYTVKFSVAAGEGTLKGTYDGQTKTAQDDGAEVMFTNVPHGTQVPFTAPPKYAWEVKGWTKGTDAVNGTAGSYTLTVTDNATVKVKFKKITTVNGDDGAWKLLKKVVEIADDDAVITINGTIQATNDADNSGEITFGTLANKLTIQGGSSAVLDANGKSRIFKVESGKTLTLKNLTLQNGAVPNPPYGSRGGGGGILVDGSTVRMTNCTIKDCKAGEQSTVGGAIRIEGAGAKVYIAGGEISGNRANRGGGISISGGKLYVNTDDSGNPNDSSTQTNITNNLVAHNGFGYAGDGGAIYSDSNAELKLHNTKISRCGSKTSRNPSTTQGGGLYIDRGTAVLTLVEISHGIFETIDGGGYDSVQGGAICSENADVTLGKSGTPAYSCYIHHNTIRGNDSRGAFEGGGIYSYKGTLKIYGGKIESNKVEGHLAKGGGIAQNDTNLLLDGTVITDNTASYRGGGVDGLNNRSFTMKGSATVTPSTQTNTSTVKYNDVYLPRPLYRITIEGELTPVGGTAARITPEDYATTPPVLAGDITTGSNYTKFKVTPPNDSEVWKIDNNGCLKKQ